MFCSCILIFVDDFKFQLYKLKEEIDVECLGEQEKIRERETRRRITKMCLFLVGVFLICNITDCIWWLLRNKDLHPIFTCSTDFAETLNSSVNVIIYSVFGKMFREKFVTLFCKKSEEQPNNTTAFLPHTSTNLYTEKSGASKPQIIHNIRN